jgi:hypothetical protein
VRPWPLLLLPLLVGCPPATTDDDDSVEPEVCEYPEGAVEPMELGAVLTAHSWPAAIAPDGGESSLALTDVYCNDDFDPFEVLLFVSIPAW